MPDEGESSAGHEAHSKEKVTIREMDIDDVAEVFHLGEKLFTAEKWPNLYRTWDEYEVIAFFASDGETCLVAEIGDRIVGFALGNMLEKRRGAWVYGYLVWLGVEPSLGRTGVGAKLFKRLSDIFMDKGARMLLVDTDPRNQQAVKFFKKQGFGHETDHVYLTMNLTHTDGYKKRRSKGSK